MQRFAVLGHPINHSFSPVMHMASFRSIGFDGDYVRLDVPPEMLGDALKALADEGFTGVNLTIPHKMLALPMMDTLTPEAERLGVGVIPSLFWNHTVIPDLMKEPVSAWGNADSKTREFARNYAKDVVSRYKDSPAVWGWEFGNEYALSCDLPGEHLPYVAEVLGTPAVRTKADMLTRKMILTAYVEFAKLVRGFDKTRPIFSGDALPRASAWHNIRENNWTQDTLAQFEEVITADNPSPMDTTTVHIYWGDMPYDSFKNLEKNAIKECMAVAAKNQKPLFVGEWGVVNPSEETAERKRRFYEFARIMEESGVQLSAYWAFDISFQPEFNVTSSNGRSYILEKLRDMNSR